MRIALVLWSFALGAGCTTDNGALGAGGGDMPAPIVAQGDLALAVSGFDASGFDQEGVVDMATITTLIGIACPQGTECGAGHVCLSSKLSGVLPPGGFCSQPCMVDGDCGPGAFCGPAIPGVGQLCFANCDANGGCAGANRVCSRRFDGSIDLVKSACLPGNAQATDGAPCMTFGDCNRDQACLTNPYEQPGGYCITLGCAVGNNSTCSPAPGNAGICVAPVAPSVFACLPGCTSSSDCRADESYSCTSLTPNNAGPSACLFQHAAPGSACSVAKDCAAADSPWACLTGASFPKGYCGAPLGTCDPAQGDTCPDKSSCYDPTPKAPHSGDELCAANCTMDADCRVGDGYHCMLDATTGNHGCRTM